MYSGNSINSAFQGSAIYSAVSSYPLFHNLTIAQNVTTEVEYAVGGGVIFTRFNSVPTMINCILWNDSTPEISIDPASFSYDNSGKIVIDEVAGLLVTVIGVPFEWPLVVTAFLVFRFFDIVKPPPVRQIDAKLGGGAGVILDDSMAGIYGLGVMHGLYWLNGGWW